MRLRCANIRCSSQTIAEIRLEIVLFRYICTLAETICNLLMGANSNAAYAKTFRLVNVFKRIVTND